MATHRGRAAELLLALAARDSIRLEAPLKEEVRDLLRQVWRRAGHPVATDNHGFIGHMRAAVRARRNPAADVVPPSVFVAEELAWVHVPSFRATVSIPGVMNKLYNLPDIRNGLLLLGFTYEENVTRRAEGDSETVCLWRGPLETLEG